MITPSDFNRLDVSDQILINTLTPSLPAGREFYLDIDEGGMVHLCIGETVNLYNGSILGSGGPLLGPLPNFE